MLTWIFLVSRYRGGALEKYNYGWVVGGGGVHRNRTWPMDFSNEYCLDRSSLVKSQAEKQVTRNALYYFIYIMLNAYALFFP